MSSLEITGVFSRNQWYAVLMHIQVLHSDQASLLEEFVSGHPRGSIEQTWAWGGLQTQIPGRPEFRVFGLFEGEKIVGSMLLVRQAMGFGKAWLWCPRGPLLPLGQEKEAWDLLREACANWAGLHGAVFLRVESGCLKADEVVVRGKDAKECYLPEDTLMLDLTLSEEKLLAGMNQSCRRNLKKAAGVKVGKGTEEDFLAFYRLLKETAVRDGFHVHQDGFYKAFLRDLGDKAVFYVAKLEEEVVGGALMVHFGDTATYYFGASANAAREAKVGHAIQWHAIAAAKAARFKKYDFLGIAPEGNSRHSLAGVTQFKLGFGGNRVSYQKTQAFVYRRLWWWAYRLAKALRI